MTLTLMGERHSMRRGVASPSLCLALAVCVPLSGCGALLFRKQQVVPVECTNVPTARFVVQSEGNSLSGGSLQLDRTKDYAVEVRAEGYATKIVSLKSEFSFLRATLSVMLNGGHGLFTLFISTVLCVPIDIVAGAWVVLEPTELRVQLVPDASASQPQPQGQASAPWPTASPTPSAFCESCGARAGTTAFCTSCGAQVR